MELYPAKSAFVSSYWRDKYEKDARRYWDKFYLRNSDRFFKDRHYLDKEWGQYFKPDSASGTGTKVLLEVGCGAGNTVFPLLTEYPHLFVHACDFSPRAVQIVQDNEQCTPESVHAFVCDIASDELAKDIALSSVDIVSMVFMLSAVSPERMPGILQNLKTVMKPGSVVLFRDYAVGDLAEERLKKKDQQICDNFFVRGDGTRAFYFSEGYLSDLFIQEGFAVKSMITVCKVVENRSKGLKMDRRWIQAVFCLEKPGTIDGTSDDNEVALEDSIGMDMFVEAPVVEDLEIELGQYRVRAKCIPRVHQHTCRSTGLMLWESALAFSRLMLDCPLLVAGKSVLELGCGCVGLCSLLASFNSRKVVATDCDQQALQLLRDNLEANSGSFPVDRISCRKLTWGNSQETEALLLEESPGGFDMVVGTDVTYVPQALGSLFSTAAALLCHPPAEGEVEAQLLLCHFARRVAEPEIVAAARQHGFKLKCSWLTTDKVPPPFGLPMRKPQLVQEATGTTPVQILQFSLHTKPAAKHSTT